ncbi:MAG: sulfur carrier protein ThiS [Actinomycetota bacterium]|nr:sulfur carrier protein ThiS [Actinomycetota bacterium]
MRVIVNGQPRELGERPTVDRVVAAVASVRKGRGTAVAVNGVVVPRAVWPSTELGEDDKVEVLDAIGGG